MADPARRWDSDAQMWAPASVSEGRLVQARQGLKARGERVLGSIAFRAASSTAMRQRTFNALRLGRSSVSRLTPLTELQLVAYVFGNRERSQAQILQDLWVCSETWRDAQRLLRRVRRDRRRYQ